jgi:hypothetical protein
VVPAKTTAASAKSSPRSAKVLSRFAESNVIRIELLYLKLRIQVLNRKVRWPLPKLRFGERQKESEGIAVSADCGGTRLALLLQPLDEEPLQEQPCPISEQTARWRENIGAPRVNPLTS